MNRNSASAGRPRKRPILVGFVMMPQVAAIDFDDLDTAIPAFIKMRTIPLTFSTVHGIVYASSRWSG